MSEFSPADVSQRSPLLRFYLLALSFAVALIFTRLVQAPWLPGLYATMALIAGLALYSFSPSRRRAATAN